MDVLGSLKKRLRKDSLDGILISKPANVSYLTGFTGDDSSLLITQEKNIFITDFRYYLQAKAEVVGFRIEAPEKVGYFDFIAGLIEKNRLKRVGFEAKNISYGQVSQIRDRLRLAEFIPTYNLIEDFRVVKTRREIGLIKKAVAINLAAIKETTDIIKIGDTEKQIASLLEFKIKIKGADSVSFDTIVLSGKRSALPHGRPAQQRIAANQVLLIDSGACFCGYNSDLTRIVFLGKIRPILKKIYGIVKTAQKKAIDKIRPGVKASYIDSVARGYINKSGFGKYFGHSLGHGVGREVHEAPSLSSRSNDVLKPGMVFTVEPAIYLPDTGGVRIEDMVVITDKGVEILT
jgi:Xaa-Pro aminopeptidase